MQRHFILLFAIFVLATAAWLDGGMRERSPAEMQWAQAKDKSKDSAEKSKEFGVPGKAGCLKGKTWDKRSNSCI